MKIQVREIKVNDNFWNDKFPEGLDEEEALEVNPAGEWTTSEIELLLSKPNDLDNVAKQVNKTPEQAAMMLAKCPILENTRERLAERPSKGTHSIDFFSKMLINYSS